MVIFVPFLSLYVHHLASPIFNVPYLGSFVVYCSVFFLSKEDALLLSVSSYSTVICGFPFSVSTHRG